MEKKFGKLMALVLALVLVFPLLARPALANQNAALAEEPVPGVIVGAILMGVINIGMSIMGVDANYQKVVKGLVLLAAVIFDVVSKRKEN